MNLVTIEVVPKPASFDDVRFTKEQWLEASKRGPLDVPPLTARENIRNSAGLYRYKPVETAKVPGAAMFDIPNLDRAGLFLAAHTLGVRIQKTNIPTEKLREFVAARYAKFLSEGADEEDEPEPAAE
jgi:hypothetical protein